MTFKERQNHLVQCLKIPVIGSKPMKSKHSTLCWWTDMMKEGALLPRAVKASPFKHPWMLCQVTCFMSPLWDQTLPGRAPVAPTEKSLCNFAFVIMERLCTISQQPKFCCRMSAPLPFNDVLPVKCPSLPLPQACCFTLEHCIRCLPNSVPWKNCKSVPFTLSVLFSVLYPIRLPCFPRRVLLTCHCREDVPCPVTRFCCPSPIFPFSTVSSETGHWSCMYGADEACQESRQQLGSISTLNFQLNLYT